MPKYSAYQIQAYALGGNNGKLLLPAKPTKKQPGQYTVEDIIDADTNAKRFRDYYNKKCPGLFSKDALEKNCKKAKKIREICDDCQVNKTTPSSNPNCRAWKYWCSNESPWGKTMSQCNDCDPLFKKFTASKEFYYAYNNLGAYRGKPINRKKIEQIMYENNSFTF